jgi:hypothetical protein
MSLAARLARSPATRTQLADEGFSDYEGRKQSSSARTWYRDTATLRLIGFDVIADNYGMTSITAHPDTTRWWDPQGVCDFGVRYATKANWAGIWAARAWIARGGRDEMPKTQRVRIPGDSAHMTIRLMLFIRMASIRCVSASSFRRLIGLYRTGKTPYKQTLLVGVPPWEPHDMLQLSINKDGIFSGMRIRSGGLKVPYTGMGTVELAAYQEAIQAAMAQSSAAAIPSCACGSSNAALSAAAVR